MKYNNCSVERSIQGVMKLVDRNFQKNKKRICYLDTNPTVMLLLMLHYACLEFVSLRFGSQYGSVTGHFRKHLPELATEIVSHSRDDGDVPLRMHCLLPSSLPTMLLV